MPAALEFDQVRFRHRGDVDSAFALEIDRFAIASGEQVLLAGRSGSGKSTLLALAAGLVEPDSGTIRVAGDAITSVRGAARDRLRGRRIGMIFQTFHLLHGFSALENVEAALLAIGEAKSLQRSRARELLAALGIERASATVDELSVGQQQRVAVARALAPRPAIVLADEPTASLDPENAGAAIDLVQSLCREHGASLLLTSHDPSMTARFERVESIERFVRGAGAVGGATANSAAAARSPAPGGACE